MPLDVPFEHSPVDDAGEAVNVGEGENEPLVEPIYQITALLQSLETVTIRIEPDAAYAAEEGGK